MATPLRQYVSVFRGLTRDAKLLILAGSINALPLGALAVAVPIYLKLLGYEEAVIGIFFSILGAVAVVLTIPFGILADRYGRKGMLVAGGVFAAVSFFLLPAAGSLPVLYAIAAIGGLAEALFFSTLQALLADASTDENRTAVFGISFFGTSAAMALSSLAASSPDLLRSAGWDVTSSYTPLWLATGFALLTSPIILARVTVRGRQKTAEVGLLPRRSLRVISRFFVANIIIGVGAGLIVPIFSLWFLLKFAQTEGFVGPLFALGAATNAFAFLVAPILARRYGMVRTAVGFQGGATVMLFAMALTPWLSAAAVLYLARNAAMNMTWPVMSAFLMGIVEPDERASASAVTGVSFRLPFAVSTVFGAAMMAQNPDLPLLVTTALYAVGTTAFYVFFRGVPERRVEVAPAAPARR